MECQKLQRDVESFAWDVYQMKIGYRPEKATRQAERHLYDMKDKLIDCYKTSLFSKRKSEF
jgi:hypothetical protein